MFFFNLSPLKRIMIFTELNCIAIFMDALLFSKGLYFDYWGGIKASQSAKQELAGVLMMGDVFMIGIDRKSSLDSGVWFPLVINCVPLICGVAGVPQRLCWSSLQGLAEWLLSNGGMGESFWSGGSWVALDALWLQPWDMKVFRVCAGDCLQS